MDPFDLIGKRIQDLSDLYDNDGPSAVDQGSRPMFANGQLVQPNADGLRPGYKGTRISFTEKEVKQINTDLPKGIKLTKEIRAGEPYYYWRLNKSYKDKTIAKNKVVTDKDFTKDIGLKTLKKDLNGFIEINLPNALTQEKYEKLRYDNENLTQEDFLKKLNSEGYTTVQGDKFSRSNVNRLDSSIGLKKMKSYSLKEQTQFLKNTINGSEELRDINKLPISKVDKENRIRKLANSIRSRDNRNNTLGSFAFTDSKEAKLWKNFFSASRGDRIEIGGTFEGKDLSQRKNWPRDKDGKVNWGKKGLDGKPAWKYATFTDTQTPKGDVTFTFDNLKNQVDETFGSGYFDSSTSPYTEQKQSYKNLEGKKLAENRIKEEYYKKYNKYPSDGYVSQRMRPYAPAQVHHYGENGIMGDPYKVQLVSRSANQSLGKAEMTYKADLKKAQGNPVKINEIKNNFINKINNISNEMGGIKFTFEGQQYGSESTPQAAYDFEKQDLDKLTTKNSEAKAKILENIDKNKFRRVSTVLVNSAKEGGFGEAIQKICMRKKAKKGGRMFLSNGSGCPAADQDPKGFLKSVSDNPQLAKFFKSGTGQKLAGAAARVTGNVLNPTTLIGGEVAFVLGDGLNNFASGLPLDESFDRAFVFGDFGKFEKNLMNKAKELGYDDNQLNLLQETMNINKLDNREKKLKYGLDNETPGSEDLIMGFPERLADTKNQLDNSVQNYIGTLDKMGFDLSKDSTYDVGFRYLDNAFKKRTQDQLVEDFKDRERQIDPTKTPFGNFISPAFDLSSYTQPLKYGLDIINPFTKDVPFLSEQQQEAKKLRDMSQEDLDIYNKNRKFTLEDIQSGESPYTRQLMDYLGTDVTGQGFGSQFLAGGGIASLTKTIPPESGQTPHGLPYVYNNVKKI